MTTPTSTPNSNASPCYVLPDGHCVSPLSCDHGPGMPLQLFAKRARDAGCAHEAFAWLLRALIEASGDEKSWIQVVVDPDLPIGTWQIIEGRA